MYTDDISSWGALFSQRMRGSLGDVFPVGRDAHQGIRSLFTYGAQMKGWDGEHLGRVHG